MKIEVILTHFFEFFFSAGWSLNWNSEVIGFDV